MKIIIIAILGTLAILTGACLYYATQASDDEVIKLNKSLKLRTPINPLNVKTPIKASDSSKEKITVLTSETYIRDLSQVANARNALFDPEIGYGGRKQTPLEMKTAECERLKKELKEIREKRQKSFRSTGESIEKLKRELNVLNNQYDLLELVSDKDVDRYTKDFKKRVEKLKMQIQIMKVLIEGEEELEREEGYK